MTFPPIPPGNFPFPNPPFGSNSFLEQTPNLMSAGPAPGIVLLQEILPGRIRQWPALMYGVVQDDAAWTNYAAQYLLNRYGQTSGQGTGGGGGLIELGPYVYSAATQVTLPEHIPGDSQHQYAVTPVSLQGVKGATVWQSTAGTAFYKHRTHMWGPVQNNQPNPMKMGGYIRDITVDGQFAGTGSTGIDIGDGWGLSLIDVMVINYFDRTGPGTSKGIWKANRVDWTEKFYCRAHTINCDNHVVNDLISGNISQEYDDFDLYMYILGAGSTANGNGQNGITYQNGAFQGGGSLKIRGNHGGQGSGTPGNLLTVQGNDGSGNWSQLFNVFYDVVVESNSSTNNPIPVVLGNASNSVTGWGQFVPQFGGWAPSQLNGGNFSVSGHVSNDSILTSQAFSLPSSGNQITYHGSPGYLYIEGGTISALVINGVSINAAAIQGPFYLRQSSTFKITYTVAPIIQFVPEGI